MCLSHQPGHVDCCEVVWKESMPGGCPPAELLKRQGLGKVALEFHMIDLDLGRNQHSWSTKNFIGC